MNKRRTMARSSYSIGLPGVCTLLMIGVASVFWVTGESRGDWAGLRRLLRGTATALAKEPDVTDKGDVAFWTCPMHPSVKEHQPGHCPFCNMNLVAVTSAEAESGVIFVDAERRQRIGVRTAKAEHKPLHLEVRAPARVAYDETRLSDVNLKFVGWITKIYADTTGDFIRKGEPLFDVYSQELVNLLKEYLAVLHRTPAGERPTAPGVADAGLGGNPLIGVYRQRLRQYDLTDQQIRHMAETGEVKYEATIMSPASGYVVEKSVVQGTFIPEGARLYRIAQLDRVWVLADIFESDLPLVKAGQEAQIRPSSSPDRRFTGRVEIVYPTLGDETRTAKVRIPVANSDLALRPGQSADVTISVDLGERLVVPKEAVLYTGPRRLVFVDLGEGKLRPQEITVGARGDDDYEVLKGLKAGDVVVTSGNFLIAAESRIRSAERVWGRGGDGAN
jgi:membrane fusion protein, copper/silver efflux system